MGPLLEWIKWYQESDLRKQENDLRAVALQNQRMELDYNMGRQKASIASEEEANKPLYTTQGETISSGGTRPSEGKPEVSSYTPPPTPGPSANQMKAVGAGIENIPDAGLAQMGMVRPAPNRYIQVGNVIWDTSTKSVVYKPPEKSGDVTYDVKELSDGRVVMYISKADLPTAQAQGLMTGGATVEEDPDDPESALIVPKPKPTSEGVSEKGLPTDIPVSKVPLPPGASPARPKATQKPEQGKEGKPRQISPGLWDTGMRGKPKEVTPHNELDSMSQTIYPGRSWAELGPEEKDAVLKQIGDLSKVKKSSADISTEREHMGNALKSAYTIEMRNLMAKYKLMPNDAAVETTDLQAILNPNIASNLSPEQFKKYEAEATEIHNKTMGKWYKLYNIEPPKRGVTPPADAGGGGSQSYVRDKSGKMVPSSKK